MHSQPRMTTPRYFLTLGLLLSGFGSANSYSQEVIDSWGNNDDGEVLDTPSGADFTQLAAGTRHSLALRIDGSIAAWGISNGGGGDHGQVTNTPSGIGFTQVSASLFSSLALRSDGSIIGWGSDLQGQISNIPAGTGFTNISMGSGHGIALRADGSIQSWGADNQGVVSNTPTGTSFIQVSAGDAHSLALRTDGSVVAWGRQSASVGFPFGDTFTQIATGIFHVVGLRTDGSISVGGADFDGNGITDPPISQVPAGTDFTQVVAHGTHSVALRSNGTVASWGQDPSGVVTFSPTGSGFTHIATGGAHSLALTSNNVGEAFCSGYGPNAGCPCDQSGGSIPGGCANSNPEGGAQLQGVGNAFLSNDTFELRVIHAPANKIGLVLRGINQLNGGHGLPVGDGLLCVAGQSARSLPRLTSSTGMHIVQHVEGAGFGAWSYGPGVETNYQFWFRDQGNACSGQDFNFSNAWRVTWLP